MDGCSQLDVHAVKHTSMRDTQAVIPRLASGDSNGGVAVWEVFFWLDAHAVQHAFVL